MIFSTIEFGVFFAAVFVLYHVLPRRGQNVLLLGASYLFYSFWDWRFLSLILISTAVDFYVARAMPQAPAARRKHLLWISLTTNLGLLGFFKYFDFFIDSLAALLTAMGFEAHLPTLRILLPVGISFYTFQTLAYTIDVYRGHLQPTRSLMLFAIYVAYFPQLVAGPIERAQNLLPQFAMPRRVGVDQLASGALLFFIGLLRKVAIADFVAPYVNGAFADPGNLGAAQLTAATLLFALQIYGDFAGYSDMARGVSRMLGIELMENFQQPYFSVTITEFWRRWHVSLSSWLRDYLYIPLGGNRGGRLATNRNLMLTMLLGGLWHGASWNFVVWGGLHGAALVAHRLWLRGQRPKDKPEPEGFAEVVALLPRWLGTMGIVAFAWIFFRAATFDQAFEVIAGIASLRPSAAVDWLPILTRALLIALFLDLPQYLTGDHTAMLRWSWPVRGVCWAVLAVVLLFSYSGQDVPFIYFQF